MIADVRLQHFRSYADSSFEFGEGVNIIVGPNASGKTNLLEAILVLCRGNSYRAHERELLMHDKGWARLDGHALEQDRTVKLELENERVKKTYTIGGTSLKRLPLERTIPVVVFEPNHLQLLTQSPELRRNFIDDIIEQTVPAFGQLRRQYRRALAQRNSLLKQSHRSDQLFVWNLRLSDMGGQIANHRLEFIQANQTHLDDLYGKLVGRKHKVTLDYETNLDKMSYGTAMLKGLEARVSIDKERGYTTLGPHRDDIVPVLDGYALSEAASRGETRTMLLALKLLELQSIEKVRNTKPILLLDDVFSELDGSRRRALTEYLRDHQTFITTTDADIVTRNFSQECTIIPTSFN